MTSAVDFYNQHAESLIRQYDSVTFDTVHPIIATRLRAGQSILDVGCGSGRDAVAMHQRGLQVIAVDPSHRMLEHAKSRNNQITWLADSLPALENVSALHQSFDVILLSAVWMHIPPAQRQPSLERLYSLLKPGGELYILLRHGTFSDGRQAYPVSFAELQNWCFEHGQVTATLLDADAADVLARKDVYWQLVLLKKHDA